MRLFNAVIMIKTVVLCYLLAGVTSTFATQQPVPISNLGNTCFMNAMLQCLMASPFSNQLDALSKNPFPKESAASAYFDFVKKNLILTFTGSKALEPIDLCTAVRQKITKLHAQETLGRNQDDPMAAFQAIVEGLEGYVTNPFRFVTQEFLQYQDIKELGKQAKHNSVSIAPPLTIATVKTLLQNYFLIPETRQQRYGSTNIEVTVTRRMIELPQILLVQVERSKGTTLNTQPITLSLTLDPKDFGSVGKPPVSYKLFASILFSGTAKSGHYIAQVRYENNWYLCDDDKITKLDHQPTDIPKFITVAFFYEREPLGGPRATPASAVIQAPPSQLIPALERLQTQFIELKRQLTPTT